MTTDTHNAYQRGYFDRGEGGNVRLEPTDSPYARRHLDRTLSLLDARPDQRILEVGAGLGRFTSLMLARNLKVVASDLSPELLASLRARHPGLETIACDVAEVSKHTRADFDRVVGFFMLHHLTDFDRVFAGLHAILRSGGRVAFCEPNAYCPLYYGQIVLSRHMTWQGDGGVRHMRPAVVLRSMERAGFVLTRAELYGFMPPFLYNRPSGRRLDRALEAVPLLTPFRSFQIFSASVP